jgi:hypothetical protein
VSGKRVAIPLAKTGDVAVDRALEAITANVNGIVGQEENASALVKYTRSDLAAAATLAEVVAYLNARDAERLAQINALIDRLQGNSASATRATRPEADPPAPPPAPAPGPTPAPSPTPAPTPAPSPAPGVPTVSNMARHPKDWLKIGGYMLEDNRWGAAAFTEGPASYQYTQQVERSLVVGAGGEISFRMNWRWPVTDQWGGDVASGPYPEVKCYPAAIAGDKPGYYGPDQWPAWDFAVRAPDGATVPTPTPSWTPQPIKDDWQSLGGSVINTAPSGGTGHSMFPVLLTSLSSMKGQARVAQHAAPDGIGHLSYDLWLQASPGQTAGFAGADITHEIMIPLMNWGNYGSPHTVGGAWSKAPGWYSHSVTIDGVTYMVYAAGSGGNVEYNFSAGTLDGSHTNRETGGPRTGWKFITLVPQTFPGSHPSVGGLMTVNIAAILAHLRTRTDARGMPWLYGDEYLVSAELGVEAVTGSGDIQPYDFKVF